MYRHGPDCLEGPVSRITAWWAGAAPSALPATPPGEANARSACPDGRPIRQELVERIRREIAAGTYDTQEKWEAALERMLSRLELD